MIKIKIHNVQEIVEQEKGRLVSRIAPLLVDLERKVEETIVSQLEEVFQSKNIKASIIIEKE